MEGTICDLCNRMIVETLACKCEEKEIDRLATRLREVEAERDELRRLLQNRMKDIGELAARLRAVREANDEGGDDIAGIQARRFVIRQILDGPVPPCDGGEEKDDLIGHAIAIISCYLDGGHAVPDVDNAAREWLARHEGSSDE